MIKNGQSHARFLLVTADGSFHCMGDQAKIWTMEESLTHIASSIVIDLPSQVGISLQVDELGQNATVHSTDNILHRLFNRWVKHIGDLTVCLIN